MLVVVTKTKTGLKNNYEDSRRINLPDLPVPNRVYLLSVYHAFLIGHLKSRIFRHRENYLLHLTWNWKKKIHINQIMMKQKFKNSLTFFLVWLTIRFPLFFKIHFNGTALWLHLTLTSYIQSSINEFLLNSFNLPLPLQILHNLRDGLLIWFDL